MPGLCTYLYLMQFQYSSSFCLNTDTVDAETTASGKEFHMLITLSVKKFSLNWSLGASYTASYDGPLCSGLDSR